MRTACSSSRREGGLVLIPLNFPLGCWPGPDPTEFPPWVWAWIWSPSISPWVWAWIWFPLNIPLGCGPGSDPPQFLPWVWAWIWSPSISPLGVGLEGISTRHTFYYGLLVCWPSGVVPSVVVSLCCGPSGVVLCYSLLAPRKTIPEGHLQQKAPNQKTTTEDHNRRP